MPKKRDEDAPYWVQLRQAERSIIEFALEHGQSVRGTAALLGISANYLRERTRELNIVTPEIKPGPKPGAKSPTRPDKPGPKPGAKSPTRPDKPDLRVVAANGVPRPPTMPAGAPLRVDDAGEDQNDDELEDEALDDEGDEDDDEEDDAEDDAEDDTEDDVDTEAQGGN
jgi:type IV secretory pathway VirB10-like protein